MIRAHKRFLFATILGMSALVAACERADEVGLTGPASVQLSPNAKEENGRHFKVLRNATPQSALTFWTHSPINKHGGKLDIGPHQLIVPKNSVRTPTFFSATIVAGEFMRIDLRAEEPNGRPVTDFQVPVKLIIDFSAVADQIPDKSRVVVVYHNPNGALELIPCSVDPKTNQVTAYLTHFSDYSPATD
ncbi:MAG: hypothetical protein ACT4O1_03165 [Gemmatimonadota bacterium]